MHGRELTSDVQDVLWWISTITHVADGEKEGRAASWKYLQEVEWSANHGDTAGGFIHPWKQVRGRREQESAGEQ